MGAVVEAEQHDDAYDEGRAAEQDAQGAYQPVHPPRQERDDHGAEGRQEHRQGDRRLVPTTHEALSYLRTVKAMVKMMTPPNMKSA